MPLSFLLTLVTYLIAVAACFRANTPLAAGAINTATLAIVLFAALNAGKDGPRRAFWRGFLLFFAALNMAYFVGTTGLTLGRVTLADAAGQGFDNWQSGNPLSPGPVFRDYVWYSFLANSYLSTLFGIGGGMLAMAINRKSKPPTARDPQ